MPEPLSPPASLPAIEKSWQGDPCVIKSILPNSLSLAKSILVISPKFKSSLTL